MKLHLVLKSKWYGMIANGEKTEEYREFNTYWKKRLGTNKQDEAFQFNGLKCVLYGVRNEDGSVEEFYLKNFESVVFHKGYSNETMEWTIRKAGIGIGVPQWGGGDKPCFIIELNKRVA